MRPEEAREELKRLAKSARNDKEVDAYDWAVKAIEKAILKPVTDITYDRDLIGSCPICHRFNPTKNNYCHYCGQGLRW